VYAELLKKFDGLLLVVATSNSPGWAATLYILAVTFPIQNKEFRKMKQLFLRSALALTVLLGGSMAYAQMGQGGGYGQGGYGQGGYGQGGGHDHGQGMSADQRLEMMTKQLNLTSDQQQQIKPILENESQQMESLHSDSSLSQQDRMSKMQAIRENTNSQIKPILTSEQQTKWQQMMERHGKHGGMERGPQGAPPNPQQ
jgi:Spy/CpxP family protein refolding chaperone